MCTHSWAVEDSPVVYSHCRWRPFDVLSFLSWTNVLFSAWLWAQLFYVSSASDFSFLFCSHLLHSCTWVHFAWNSDDNIFAFSRFLGNYMPAVMWTCTIPWPMFFKLPLSILLTPWCMNIVINQYHGIYVNIYHQKHFPWYYQDLGCMFVFLNFHLFILSCHKIHLFIAVCCF